MFCLGVKCDKRNGYCYYLCCWIKELVLILIFSFVSAFCSILDVAVPDDIGLPSPAIVYFCKIL